MSKHRHRISALAAVIFLASVVMVVSTAPFKSEDHSGLLNNQTFWIVLAIVCLVTFLVFDPIIGLSRPANRPPARSDIDGARFVREARRTADPSNARRFEQRYVTGHPKVTDPTGLHHR